MKCSDCCYFWKEEDESYPSCHWTPRALGDMAPCDYAEDFEDDD